MNDSHLKSEAQQAVYSTTLIFKQPFIDQIVPQSQGWDEAFKQLVEEALIEERTQALSLIEELKPIKERLEKLLEEEKYQTILNEQNQVHNQLGALRTAVGKYWNIHSMILSKLVEKEKDDLTEQHLLYIRNLAEESEEASRAYRILLDATAEAQTCLDENDYSEAWNVYKQAQAELGEL